MTRGEQYKGSDMYALPKVTGGEYVLGLMGEIGFGLAGEPLSNQEVLAWSQLTGIKLDCWTASIITTLSSDYMNQRSGAIDPGCPAPYVSEEEPSESQRQSVRDKFKSMANRG